MKKLLLLSLMAFAIQTQAQNVGIGNPAPNEKLDVTGNINVTGTIKANGTDGTAGQILQNNGNGTMSWGSIGSNLGFQNSKMMFYNTPTFVVPAGVNKVMIELWSAGAGGSNEAGGVSGSYGRITKNVSQFTAIDFEIGHGGVGYSGATFPTNGADTRVTFPDLSTIVIVGGYATYGIFLRGYPGSYGGNLDYFQPGNMGEMVIPKVYTYPNGDYLEIIDTGKGGLPPGINYNSGSYNAFQSVKKFNSIGTLLSGTYQNAPNSNNYYIATGGGYGAGQGLPGGDGFAIVWW